MEHLVNFKYISASVIYSFIGIIILVFSFWLIEKATPENLYKEILVNKNIALAIILAAFILAISIIIASAIHG